MLISLLHNLNFSVVSFSLFTANAAAYIQGYAL